MVPYNPNSITDVISPLEFENGKNQIGFEISQPDKLRASLSKCSETDQSVCKTLARICVEDCSRLEDLGYLSGGYELLFDFELRSNLLDCLDKDLIASAEMLIDFASRQPRCKGTYHMFSSVLTKILDLEYPLKAYSKFIQDSEKGLMWMSYQSHGSHQT